MGKQVGPPISEADKKWLRQQHVFFVASAPLSRHHRVNVSPKSAKEFRVVGDSTVCWLDLSGSGSETAAHIMENGRVTLLFVAFTGAPRIVRLYGKGRFIRPCEVKKNENRQIAELYPGELLGEENCDAGFRCIMVLEVTRISQSCGYSIPKFDYVSERLVLKEFSEKRGHEGMIEYRGTKNSFSIDGLKSIGQLEQGRLPTSITHSNGYILASYDSNGFISDLIGKTKVFMNMTLTSGCGGIFRDVALIGFGALLGAMFSQKKPWG